jgi:hypothetical protein
LSLKRKDVKEAKLAFYKEMKVGVEEDLFDVVFFLCRGSAMCNAIGLGWDLRFVG